MHVDPCPNRHSDPDQVSDPNQVSGPVPVNDLDQPSDEYGDPDMLQIQRCDFVKERLGNRATQRTTDRTNERTNGEHQRRNSDPMTQSLVLLATMALMLIVEEIRYAWHRGELRAEYETGKEGIRNVSLDAFGDASQLVTAVVGPSVVHIDVQRRSGLEHLNESGMPSRIPPAADQGSGVVVDSEGYVLTNRHVISDGEDITVKLSDGRRVAAFVVGTDRLTDIAVLKIEADRLIPIGWGDSDRCRVGSPVWAVGSPFGLDRTVTFGILSGKHRMVRASTEYQDFMQSPLVNARGMLIGINTAIVGNTYQGVSFSIPSNVVRHVYERIRKTGRVDRAWLGVGLKEVPDIDLSITDSQVRDPLMGIPLVPNALVPDAPARDPLVRGGLSPTTVRLPA